MLKKGVLLIAALTIFMTVPAFAAKKGCKAGGFVGSYTRVDPPTDVFGDGLTIHQYIFQLSLTNNGTASQYWTGFPDYLINFGTASPWIGSWTCRADDNLVVTLIDAQYLPVAPAASHPYQDVQLGSYTRVTYLFSVDDDDTLTRIQSRSRIYAPSADPTDPTGGTLGALNTATVQYKRLKASDADLVAP